MMNKLLIAKCAVLVTLAMSCGDGKNHEVYIDTEANSEEDIAAEPKSNCDQFCEAYADKVYECRFSYSNSDELSLDSTIQEIEQFCLDTIESDVDNQNEDNCAAARDKIKAQTCDQFVESISIVL